MCPDPNAAPHGGLVAPPSHSARFRLPSHTPPSLTLLQKEKASRLRPRALPSSSPASSPLVLTRILAPRPHLGLTSASPRPHLTRHETVPSSDPRYDRMVRAVLLLPAGPGRRRLLGPQEAAQLLRQQEGRRPSSLLAGRGAPRSGETARTPHWPCACHHAACMPRSCRNRARPHHYLRLTSYHPLLHT